MDTKQKKMNQEHINDIIQKEKKELSDIFEAIKQRETLAENVNMMKSLILHNALQIKLQTLVDLEILLLFFFLFL
jgi:hypothetical protein